MNRRLLLHGSAVSLGLLLASNQSALAALRESATPFTTAATKPEVEFSSHSPAEAMYLGILSTLLELLDDSLDTLLPEIGAFLEETESIEAKAMVLQPLGVWTHLSTDIQKYDAPASFAEVHGHAVDAFTSLGAAARTFVTGAIEDNAFAIMLGTEEVLIGTEHISRLLEALPIERPDRNIVSSVYTTLGRQRQLTSLYLEGFPAQACLSQV